MIADGLETPFQVGGVSYEKMCLTPDWGIEFDLRIDGNVIQTQIFAMALSSSWAKVGFSDLIEVPMVSIWRDAFGGQLNSIRVIVYHSAAEIESLASTGTYGDLQNNSWYTVKLLIDEDHLVRVYINGEFRFQYWLPNQYAAGPNRRALSLLNQTTNPAYIKNFRLFDNRSNLQTKIGWTREAFYDNFNRANGSVGNGWTQIGTDAGIVNNSYASTGSGSAAAIRDTGVTHGAHRVEAVVGGNNAPSSTNCTLVARVKSDGSEGLAGNVFNNAVVLSHFTGGLDNPTMIDYNSAAVSIPSGTLVALCCNGEAAWIEIGGEIVVMADMNGHVPAAGQTYAGVRVKQGSGSWNDVRIKTAF
ncbi:hypothetical protein ACFRAQ_35170 [Nocardia sp. NPDC056611]|uniref:hypothetical protein n=1 Tax=Nocardia sp. NPDC056611 TaxID=3345877 RepID=UPI00366B2729